MPSGWTNNGSGDDKSKVSSSSFPMHVEQQANESNGSSLNPAVAMLGSDSARPRAVSTPHGKESGNGIQTKNHSGINLNVAVESPPRTRRSSTPYFSIPKMFARRRRSELHSPSHISEQPLGDVIEIGRSQTQSGSTHDVESENADAERERLRDAAAHALGLGILRDTASAATSAPSRSDSVEVTPTSPYYHPTIPSPSSYLSLPTTTNDHTHTTVHKNLQVQRNDPDTLPPYPCTLAALTPFLQASVALHKYYPSSTFLALSLNRKQWKVRYVVLTSPLPPTALSTRTHSYTLLTRQSHLHLFKNAVPSPEEAEIDRLEINEDSVVYIAELDVAGKPGVLKVGGRDMAADKSIPSWRNLSSTGTEVKLEEMGRTMWLLKLPTEQDTQRWMVHVKASVLLQRAERAGVTFNHLNERLSPVYVPNMRADLEGVLSNLHSNGHLNGNGFLPSPSAYPPALALSMPNSPPSGLMPLPTPAPNPRYAQHVGAAPSHSQSTSTPSSRSRTYPPLAALNSRMPTLRGLFRSPSPSSMISGRFRSPSPSLGRRGLSKGSGKNNDIKDNESGNDNDIKDKESEKVRETDVNLEHKDIDPIAAEDASFSHRLLNMFRSPSRTSQNHRLSGPVPPPTNSRDSMQPHTLVTSPTIPNAHTLIGRPISPAIYSREGRRDESTAKGKKANGASHHSAYSVDWSTPRDGTYKPHLAPSLPPPPRNLRRPSIREGVSTPVPMSVPNSKRRESAHPSSAVVNSPPRAPSVQSTSSYISGDPDQHHLAKVVTPSPPASWPHPHPYSTSSTTSKRVSTNSVNSIGIPPPRPPPNFAPPPAPIGEDLLSMSTGRESTIGKERRESTSMRRESLGMSFGAGRESMNGRESMSSTNRESLISRSLRLTLSPAAPPPTKSLPPRPDEPAFRHSTLNGGDAQISTLYPITASPASIYTELSFISPPPAPPPPSGPLPPTPDSDKDRDRPSTNLVTSRAAYNRRLRIISPPTSPNDVNDMFLNMQDTPITPAMSLTTPFFIVAPPMLVDEPEREQEPTPLSPPPRRSSRGSKEIRRLKDIEKEKDEAIKAPVPEAKESVLTLVEALPQDSTVADR